MMLFSNRNKNSINDSFSEAHLDLREHLEDGIFYLQNGDLGTIYKLKGVYDEPLTNANLNDYFLSYYDSIKEITSIPTGEHYKNVTFQIICSQRRRHNPPEQSYIFSKRQEGEILKLDEDTLFKNINFVEREFYLTIRYRPYELAKRKSIIESFVNTIKKKPHSEVYEDPKLKEYIEIFKDALVSFESQFELDFTPKRLTFIESFQWFQDFIEKNENSTIVPSEYNIHENIIPKQFENKDDHLIINGNKVEVYYLEQIVPELTLGQFKHFMNTCPMDEWDMVWGMSELDREYPSYLGATEAWYGRQKNTKTYDEFVKFKDSVSASNPHGIQSLRVICYNPQKKHGGELRSNAHKYIGCILKQEKQILLHMYASSFPLNLRREFNRVKARYRRIKLDSSLGFFPIYDGPSRCHGVKWVCSRLNTPTKVDLLAGSGNRMAALIGLGRVGKSVYINLINLEFMERFEDGVIRIIDLKTSYQKLADMTGGRIIRFSKSEMEKHIYSPFALDDWDEDDIEALYLLISTCILQKNPDCQFTAIHSEILKESIKLAYNLQSEQNEECKSPDEIDPHPIWPDIVSKFQQAVNNLKSGGVSKGVNEAREDLARWSVSLNISGQYGFLFSKHEPKREKSSERFIVYDLDGIQDKVLKQLAAMMAFIKITRDLKKLPLKTRKFIVFEEFGMMLIGDKQVQELNSEFVQNIFKTCAKYQAQAITNTNDVKDYTEYEAGRTVWKQATQKIFLSLGSMYEKAHESWGEEFNEGEWEIIKSLKKDFKNKRSSVYIKSNNEIAPYEGCFYVHLSPAMDALTTTSGDQLGLYKNLRDKGHLPHEALNIMSTEYPYGKNL